MLQIADLSCGFVLLRLGRKLTDSSQIMLCNHVKLCIIDGYGVLRRQKVRWLTVVGGNITS